LEIFASVALFVPFRGNSFRQSARHGGLAAEELDFILNHDTRLHSSSSRAHIRFRFDSRAQGMTPFARRPVDARRGCE